jgi:hypothetical protein
MDLVNLPPPTGGSTDMGDPDVLLPPPSLHFNTSITTFGFDGGGPNTRAGALYSDTGIIGCEKVDELKIILEQKL